MSRDTDDVTRYGINRGIEVKPRTVLVEGNTDVNLFKVAANLEREATGISLLGNDLAIAAAGDGINGGAGGVVHQLLFFRGLARACLSPDGRPLYRFIGLFDNDWAGKQAIKMIRHIDASILEYKDVFLLWPVMPIPGNLDPGALRRAFENDNSRYKGLDWEIEDFISTDFIEAFQAEYPSAIIRVLKVGDKMHHDFSTDGKAQFHKYVQINAVRDDIIGVIELLKAIRRYLLLRY